ncbi:MAG: hypothetical protein IPK66_15195 [Rhodospirillales bacterium]|nr:hypothetical protein [Rhodospirillales bacterium]
MLVIEAADERLDEAGLDGQRQDRPAADNLAGTDNVDPSDRGDIAVGLEPIGLQ